MFVDDVNLMNEGQSMRQCIMLERDLEKTQLWSLEWPIHSTSTKNSVMKTGKSEKRPESVYNGGENKLHESTYEKDLLSLYIIQHQNITSGES